MGADWVELDVRRTRDGRLAVHHDAVLPDGRAIVELTAAQLPPAVPSLAAALEACVPMGVNVEIKNSPQDVDFDETVAIAAPVVAAIDAAIDAASVEVIVSSFHSPTLARVRAVAPHIATAQLTFELRDPQRLVERVAAAGHVALHPFDATVTAELVAVAHEARLAVNVWTVDDPDRMRELADIGVDGIVTNVPDVAVRALRG